MRLDITARNSKQTNHTAVSITAKLKETTSKIRKRKLLYIMLVPGLLYFLIFKYVPMYGVLIAFKDFNFSKGIMGSPWVGTKYFEILFRSKDFWLIFWNTLIINLYKLAWGFPGPIIIALLLNEVRKMWFKRIIQTSIYLPHFISWIVIGGMFIQMLSPSNGIINTIIKSFGHDPISFVTEPKYFRSLMVLTSVWKEAGWGAIVYLAALSGIDMQLYESAMIDGAGKWKQLIHITLPGIAPTIIIMLILRIGQFLDVGFEQTYVFLTQFTYSVGDVFSTYVFRVGLEQAKFSYTTAVGLFQSVINFILIVSANKLANKTSNQGMW